MIRLALFLITLLAGCQQYSKITAPVEQPSRSVAGPGVCITTLEWPSDYDATDTSETCWDGSKPHMVEYTRPRTPGLTCEESTWMPEGRIHRKFGCRKRVQVAPI